MGMVVRTNIMAINANRSLGINNTQVSKNLEKLSSGFKINRAADDSAGLAISEKMKAQIKGLEQASLNSQDGISLVQTAEGALTEVHDMLNRMKELATKSSNGTIQDTVDRAAIQNEVNKLNDEIDRIAQSTNFNGINLLDGSLSSTGGAGGAAGVKLGKENMTLVDVAATKGLFTMATALSVSGAGAASGGEVYKLSLGLDNGKSINIELTFDKAKNAFISADGKEYANALGSNAISTTALADVMTAALKDTKLGDDYKITQTNGELTFEAKVEGSSTAGITSIGQEVQLNGIAPGSGLKVATSMAVGSVKGADAYQTVDVATGFTVFDGTNAKQSVFTINGKKFAIVASGAADSVLKDLDKNVTVIRASGATVHASQAAAIAAEINRVAGTSLKGDNNTGLIDLKNTDGSSVAGSGGLTLQIGDTGDAFNSVSVSVQDMSATGIGTKGLDVGSQPASSDAIQVIMDAINYVSTNRSEMGALQNRLEHTINNLDVAAENMTSANSRIRDTDMAKQMMEYTKMNVLTQSAQAMLAQANQQPQSILQLLQ